MKAYPRMRRLDGLERLAAAVTDEIVVATYSTATDWLAICDRPLNYFAFGAMGLASSHALGLALAFPERRVIVLDGDGSLLMNLGTLVTIAGQAPPNLAHTVWCNGTYEANGGLPLPSDAVDFAGMARSAGIRASRRASTLDDVSAAIPDLLHAPGPVFLQVDVEQGELGPRSYKDMYSAERRRAFRQAVAG